MFRAATTLLAAFTVLLGGAYPAAVTGVAQALFRHAASGSIVERDGRPVGSELVGQPFSDPRYFWGRPSVTARVAYDGLASSGSNQGPSSPALRAAVQARIAALRAVDPENRAPVPVDLVTASASGLDPHVSPAAVEYQLVRVARARGLSPEALRREVARHVVPPTLGLLGAPTVNVLELDLALDALAP